MHQLHRKIIEGDVTHHQYAGFTVLTTQVEPLALLVNSIFLTRDTLITKHEKFVLQIFIDNNRLESHEIYFSNASEQNWKIDNNYINQHPLYFLNDRTSKLFIWANDSFIVTGH